MGGDRDIWSNVVYGVGELYSSHNVLLLFIVHFVYKYSLDLHSACTVVFIMTSQDISSCCLI